MCPVCLTSAALFALSAASTGGLAAIAIKSFGARNAVNHQPSQAPSKEENHG